MRPAAVSTIAILILTARGGDKVANRNSDVNKDVMLPAHTE